ncbi:MAG: DUF1461 domain-containing protein [Coriobacteriia bacterium]|nr:DUF1461 domain-containing protein [Coriobacteriia bacterium]
MSKLYALLLLICALGLGFLCAVSAPAVRWSIDESHPYADEVSTSTALEDITPLYNDAQLVQYRATAEQTRRFVLGSHAVALPRDKTGLSGYDAASVGHLEDVEKVMVGWMGVVAFSLVISLVVLALCIIRKKQAVVFGACLLAGVGVAIIIGMSAVAGFFDFSALFEAMHSVLFPQGNWAFPAESLLIMTFPLKFWILTAAIWASVTAAIGIMYVFVGLGYKSVLKKFDLV